MSEYTFTLTRQQYETLLLMLGFATGAAHAQNNQEMAGSFLRLANEINKNNPNWTAYEVPADKENHDVL